MYTEMCLFSVRNKTFADSKIGKNSANKSPFRHIGRNGLFVPEKKLHTRKQAAEQIQIAQKDRSFFVKTVN